MVTGNIFIGFDFYHAGVYAPETDSNQDDWPGYESYGHDLNHFYVVVNACLIRFEKDGATDEDPVEVGGYSSPDLLTYLSLWGEPADRDTSGLTFVTLDRETIRDLSENYEGWRMTVTPVPLPPGLDLRLGLTIEQENESKLFAIPRRLGADEPPFAMGVKDWIAFARDNFIQIPIKYAYRLSPAQRKACIDWVISAATIAIRKNEVGDNLERGETKLLASISDNPPLPGLGAGLSEALREPTSSRFWKAIEDVASTGDTKLPPPRPVFNRDQLQARIDEWDTLSDQERLDLTEELFGKKVGGENDTYLEFVGVAFRALTQNPTVDAAETAQRAQEAMSRLLGFGERLRWPRRSMTPESIEDLMILRWGRSRNADQLITNAHSLLGLVFRFGPYKPKVETTIPAAGVSFRLGTDELKRLDGRNDATFATRFASAAKNLLDDVRTALNGNPPPDFKATMSPAHANGILFARPRSLQMEVAKDIFAPPDGKRRLLRVPAALLDAIDQDARAEYAPVSAVNADAAAKVTFHKRTEPQRLIRPSDLFMSGQDLELSHVDRTVCAAFQVKVNRLLIRFIDQITPATPVYEIRFVNKLKVDELEFAIERMDHILASGAQREGELWATTGINGRPEKTKEFDLAEHGFTSAPRRDDENGQPIYTIVDDDENSLTDMVGKATGNPSGGTGEGGPTVQFDLVLRPRADDIRFNLIIDARGSEDLTLHPANVFTTRLSRSAERLHERFDATLSPSPLELEPEEANRDMDIDPANNDAVLDDFGNFKKLRLELWPKTAGAPKIGLTYPASLQPLPSRRELEEDHEGKPIPADYMVVGPDSFTATGPHYGYWIAHQFTEEIVGNVRDDGDADTLDDNEADQELGRYALYTNPGAQWSLTGHVENVYNHRVPVVQSDIHLGLSVDVRSLASARSMVFNDRPDDGGKSKSPEGRIALRYHIKGKTSPETLVLTLDSRFIEFALKEYRNVDASDEGLQPGRLRFLYEALADLKHSLAQGTDPGHVKLSLERWNFNNRRRVAKADYQTSTQERSLPSIMGNLQCDGRATRSLDASQLAVWTDLLAPTFDAFVENLERNQSTDLPIELPLQEGWDWFFGEVDAIGTTTNVIRLGLSLKRAGHLTATPDQADGTPVMLREELIKFDDGLFGYNKDWDQTEPPGQPYTPEGKVKRGELLRRAAEATRTYLKTRGSNDTSPDGSALHKSFRWIATIPPELKNREETKPENADDDTGSRLRRIFGPAAEFSHFPPGIRDRVPEVSRLYLVLYAMKPVVRHKFFRDGATTEMFLQYLIDLISDLLAGRHTDRITLEKEEDMDAVELYDYRAKLQSLANDLSKKLVDTFLDRVDDVKALLEPERERQDRLTQAAAIPDPVVRQQVIDRTNREFDRFEVVNTLADSVRADEDEGSDMAIRAMIRKDPSVVNWAKGFAVGVFDPNSFSNRLYSLRIRRRIGPTKMTDEEIDAAERRFHGEPITHESILRTGDGVNYFVEALPDSIYQHSFWINYADGDVRARTAEDVIENENLFRKPGAGRVLEKQRNLSLVVDHFNPEWQLRPLKAILEPAEERYFLPSRDAPVAPVPIEPETGSESGSGKKGAKPKNPWYSEMFFREQDRTSHELLRDIFQRRLRDILTTDSGDGTESGKRRIMITPSMAAVSITDTLTFAELPNGSDETTAAGWHFIDTYFSHFLFVLTPDEEATADQPNRPDIGLRNDTIPLEIDRYVKLPPDDREDADIEPFDAKTGLHGWFAYSRAKAAQGTRNDDAAPADKKPPEPMPLREVLRELDIWINKDPNDQLSLGGSDEIKLKDVDNLFRANEPSKEPVFKSGTARLSFDRRTSKWKLIVKPPKGVNDTNPADDGVGSVVAVDFMRQVPVGDENTTIPGRVIMRVTVLDETRARTRARAQIMRNQVDVDGDLDGDLNSAFVRATPQSEWASYPPYLLTYTEDEVLQFPDPVRFLVVGPESKADNQIQTLEGWVGQSDGEHDFGTDLIWMNALNTKLQTSNGLVDLFTLDTRTDTDLQAPFLIDGSVVQMQGDHIQRAESTLQVRDKIPARHDAVVTQLLRPDRQDNDPEDTARETKGKKFYTATANGFAAIVKHMDREKIQSADPNIVVTWYTPEGVPIMEINWPVVWHDEPDD